MSSDSIFCDPSIAVITKAQELIVNILVSIRYVYCCW